MTLVMLALALALNDIEATGSSLRMSTSRYLRGTVKTRVVSAHAAAASYGYLCYGLRIIFILASASSTSIV